MALRHPALTARGSVLAILILAAATAAPSGQETAHRTLALNTARVSITGTSNIHAYTASTTTVRLTRAPIGVVALGPDAWDQIVKPGAVEAFEIAIPAATLSSPKEGLDKNMHKALKVKEHADITFRLVRLEPGAAGALKAIGVLRIAGVERDITLDLKTQRKETTLTVTGEVQLLMTDYGVKPPTAMLGMLKTDPKVTVTIEAVLTVPLT